MRRALLLAIIFCAVPARAGEAPPRTADAGSEKEPPLSAEDAEIVKQLSVLEDVDLVRNLDLFDDTSAAASQARDAEVPDAGTPPPQR